MLHFGAYREVLAVVRNQMPLSKARYCTYDHQIYCMVTTVKFIA